MKTRRCGSHTNVESDSGIAIADRPKSIFPWESDCIDVSPALRKGQAQHTYLRDLLHGLKGKKTASLTNWLISLSGLRF